MKAGRTRVKMTDRYPPEINHEGWPRLVRNLAKEGGFAVGDIDFIIFTQVRKPSIELVMGDLGLPMERTHTVMEEWGYTGSACIPMALDDALAKGKIGKGALAVFVGSGVGYNQAGGGVQDVGSARDFEQLAVEDRETHHESGNRTGRQGRHRHGRGRGHRPGDGRRVREGEVPRGGVGHLGRERRGGRRGAEGRRRRRDVPEGRRVERAERARAPSTRVAAAWGGIHVLVNNAGIVRDAQLVKWKDGAQTGMMTDEAFDQVIGVNLRGPFLCTRAVVPHLIKAGGGAVLNASSVVGLYGNFGQTNYVATKAGVIGMTKTWARELAKYKIRVNAVAPGFIATEILKAMPEKVLEGMIARTPLGRMGRPEDIANAYVWLASDAAAFVTGTVISVDGGLVVGT